MIAAYSSLILFAAICQVATAQDATSRPGVATEKSAKTPVESSSPAPVASPSDAPAESATAPFTSDEDLLVPQKPESAGKASSNENLLVPDEGESSPSSQKGCFHRSRQNFRPPAQRLLTIDVAGRRGCSRSRQAAGRKQGSSGIDLRDLPSETVQGMVVLTVRFFDVPTKFIRDGDSLSNQTRSAQRSYLRCLCRISRQSRHCQRIPHQMLA